MAKAMVAMKAMKAMVAKTTKKAMVAMKAMKAMKNVEAAKDLKVWTKSYSTLHKGKYNTWQLRSIRRTAGKVTEIWDGTPNKKA